MEVISDVIEFKMSPVAEIYYNEDNFYGIYKFSTKSKIPYSENLGFGKDIFISTIVGKMQRLTVGLNYTCKGKPVMNKKYNKWQYEMVSIEADKPVTLEDNASFLKCIVTENQAKALLNVYPDIVNMIINEEEVNLNKVKGIGDKSFEKIKDKVIENYVLCDIITMLKPYGVSMNSIKSLLKGESNPVILKHKLKENPYILTEIKGFGFKRVDLIALQLNPNLRKSDYRLHSFINYYLREVGNNEGHSRIKLSDLTEEVKNNVYECVDIYNKLIERELDTPRLLYIKDDYVGLLKYVNREQTILSLLKEIDSNNSFKIENNKIDKVYEAFKNEKGYELTNEQKKILHSLNSHNVVLLTGKAGSGKSSAIDVVIKAFSDKNISMVALSAKAVRRMVEVTGVEDCKTIHRLLGYQGKDFTYNKDNKLCTDILIIDEASMINSSLFLSLVEAIDVNTKILITFDNGQLPPIGVGNIASDLLECEFEHIELTKVHRQAQDSGILSDANIIRNGINPIDKPAARICRGNLKDMYYIFENDKQKIFDTTIDFYFRSLNNLSVDDISIIVPRKSNAINCTNSFNNKIQDKLLGNENRKVTKGDKIFKLGAKLIQRVNNKEKDVVNGEIGFLISINKEGFVVDYNGKIVDYSINDMDELELAYALTVHSMQGSQCNTILFVCDMNSYMLLSKELIYTALTRSSKRCLAIAEPKAFNIGCKKHSSKRNTWINLFKT